MSDVNVKITKDGVTAKQKARLVAEIADTLGRVFGLAVQGGWLSRGFRNGPTSDEGELGIPDGHDEAVCLGDKVLHSCDEHVN